jgi:hypothetical protein
MTKNRNHFSLEEWADFGRGRTPSDARAIMAQHLGDGCPPCAAVLELWSDVLQMAGREHTFEPPANAVRCAKALFGAFQPLKARHMSFRLAHLAGFGQPAMEGVRGAGPAASHFLFREGTLLLDMHLQPRAASDLVSMVGQVMDSTRPDRPFENQPVALVRDRDALASTRTNEFGEFHLEFKPDEDLLLTIELEDKWFLVSRLPSPQ